MKAESGFCMEGPVWVCSFWWLWRLEMPGMFIWCWPRPRFGKRLDRPPRSRSWLLLLFSLPLLTSLDVSSLEGDVAALDVE